MMLTFNNAYRQPLLTHWHILLFMAQKKSYLPKEKEGDEESANLELAPCAICIEPISKFSPDLAEVATFSPIIS